MTLKTLSFEMQNDKLKVLFSVFFVWSNTNYEKLKLDLIFLYLKQ